MGAMLRRATSTLALGAAILTAVVATTAAAATLATASKHLGAGNAAVLACDANGFAFANVVNASGQVTSVTVTGIDTSCAGGTLTVTLTNASAAAVGSGSAALPTVGFAGTATVPMSPQPLSTSVQRYYGIILGP
jgi:hypothetical protein